MPTPMQAALGADWARLPPVLQAHYREGRTSETGQMDIEFPRAMGPVLAVLRRLGALVDRRGQGVATQVDKQVVGGRQLWQRRLRYADGQVQRFDSVWEPTGRGSLIEYVNPWLGLELQPFVVGSSLHYRGLRFVLRLGRLVLTIPTWLGLGEAVIVEQALDARRFAMDFQLLHPWLGQLFRYRGVFETQPVRSPTSP